jgi:hypothetical protein
VRSADPVYVSCLESPLDTSSEIIAPVACPKAHQAISIETDSVRELSRISVNPGPSAMWT